MVDYTDQTEAELEQQYRERHENLKRSVSGVVESFDKSLHKNLLEEQQQQKSQEPQPSRGFRLFSFGRPRPTEEELSQIREEHRRHSIGYNINQSAMDAIHRDIEAMRHMDSELFESVATKIDDTLGNTALSDAGPDRSQYNL